MVKTKEFERHMESVDHRLALKQNTAGSGVGGDGESQLSFMRPQVRKRTFGLSSAYFCFNCGEAHKSRKLVAILESVLQHWKDKRISTGQ